MTHICVSKLSILGSDNGLTPGRRQAIIWTNAGIVLIGPLGTNFSEILNEINTCSFKKMHLKMSSGKWRPFFLGLNVLIIPMDTSELPLEDVLRDVHCECHLCVITSIAALYVNSCYHRLCCKVYLTVHWNTAANNAHGHDDVMKWKHFPRYWPFVRGIHRSPVNSPHKGQWRGALMFYLICAWINGWVNNREAGDLRRHRAHYDVIVMALDGFRYVRFRNACNAHQEVWTRLVFCCVLF